MFAENREILTEFGRFDPELAEVALRLDQKNIDICRRPEFQVNKKVYSLSEKLLDWAAWLIRARLTRWEVGANDIWFGITECKPQTIKGILRTTKTAFGGRFLDVETLLDVDGEEITRRRLSELSIREGNLEYLPTPKQLVEFEVRIYNLVN